MQDFNLTGTVTGRTSGPAIKSAYDRNVDIIAKQAQRKRYPILDWAYYHGPNAQRLATIASLVVGNLAVIAVAAKYVVS